MCVLVDAASKSGFEENLQAPCCLDFL